MASVTEVTAGRRDHTHGRHGVGRHLRMVNFDPIASEFRAASYSLQRAFRERQRVKKWGVFEDVLAYAILRAEYLL
jgi:hypothetical protein